MQLACASSILCSRLGLCRRAKCCCFSTSRTLLGYSGSPFRRIWCCLITCCKRLPHMMVLPSLVSTDTATWSTRGVISVWRGCVTINHSEVLYQLVNSGREDIENVVQDLASVHQLYPG
ncbi:hypothetical protein OG21DRAFT_99182 [Imleria badia]|nr:hypothetical protein OG21DRAFT_99182 [Imleria badia]